MNQGRRRLRKPTQITFDADGKIVGRKNLTIEVTRKQDALALAQLMYDIYLEDIREERRNSANRTNNKPYKR